jgi:hypothetical protein
VQRLKGACISEGSACGHGHTTDHYSGGLALGTVPVWWVVPVWRLSMGAEGGRGCDVNELAEVVRWEGALAV